jgi:predicted ATP-grasp superfamily ATP-dependent carboligase
MPKIEITDKVLVLDGRQRSALALVRSLGRRGISIAVGEDSHPCLASVSKYCKRRFVYESPAKAPRPFIDSLLEELRRDSYTMIFPMTDITCYLVSEYRDEISRYTKVPMVDRETFAKASEKGELLEICKSLGFPIPQTWILKQRSDIDNIIGELPFPVVIKPRRSRYLIDNAWVLTGVDYAFSPDELRKKFGAYDKRLPPPLIQERIPGPGAGTFVIFSEGELRAIFSHKRIREKPPSGGVSVLCESAPLNPQMRDYSIKLLKALGWHGVAMVEFKIDSRDNLPKIMEINGRFWGSLQLAINAGVDFPYMLYRMTKDGDIPAQTDYKIGVQSRWLMGDVDHLLMILFKSREKLRLPEGHPGKLKTLWEFLKFYKPQMRYEVIRSEDIHPFYHELKLWFNNLGKR